MNPGESISRVIFWYGLTCLGGAFFLYGFFPIGTKLAVKVTDPPSHIEDIPVDGRQLWKARVKQLVLLVVDALRTDFITASNTPFMWEKLSKGHACMLTARVESPTVTMPRIKAMTTGSVPQFADLVLNLASTEITHDSFLKRAWDLGLNISFYGDDTWIRLFPGLFVRSEGVNSFYVTDYTEVDENVTRNLGSELFARDWQLLVLHYLGLDHIGHVHGPRSSLIPNKLIEMDNITRRIVETLNDDSLLLITGDHGMADIGGHGGTSSPEVLVPLLAVGQSCGHGPMNVRQTDLASSISAMLGVPLPAHSSGRVLTQLLPRLDKEELLYVFHYNALALAEQMSTREKDRLKICAQHYRSFLRKKTEATVVLELYNETIDEFTDQLVTKSSAQHVLFLYLSCIILIISFLSLTFYNSSHFVIPKLKGIRDLDIAVLYGSIVAVLTLASSSFIEEEHQTWYFLCGTLAILSAHRCFSCSDIRSTITYLLAFAGLRILRKINQVGDQWSAHPDVSDWLVKPENTSWLFLTHVAGIVLTWLSVGYESGRATRILSAISLILTILFRWAEGWGLFSARLCWLTIIATILFEYRLQKRFFKSLALGWTLYTALLLRPYNIVLLAACYSVCVSRITEGKTCTRALLHVWIGNTFCFMQGTWNSLASVDVSSGYVGLSEYLPLVVGLQLASHTYVFPVLTTLLLFERECVQGARVIAAFRSGALAYTCLITFANRHHLFVWSVFSPKLLFDAMHTLVLLMVLLISTLPDLRSYRYNR